MSSFREQLIEILPSKAKWVELRRHTRYSYDSSHRLVWDGEMEMIFAFEQSTETMGVIHMANVDSSLSRRISEGPLKVLISCDKAGGLRDAYDSFVALYHRLYEHDPLNPYMVKLKDLTARLNPLTRGWYVVHFSYRINGRWRAASWTTE